MFKRYLEVVARVFFNTVNKEIFPVLLELLPKKKKKKARAVTGDDFCALFYSLAGIFLSRRDRELC